LRQVKSVGKGFGFVLYLNFIIWNGLESIRMWIPDDAVSLPEVKAGVLQIVAESGSDVEFIDFTERKGD